MINNYLDYVKSQRKAALKAMYQCRLQTQEAVTEWSEGFYNGHLQARYFEARHWRTLQKDIEAFNSYYESSLTDACFDVAFDKLRAKTGGKNEQRP